jgi:hypothetical protein
MRARRRPTREGREAAAPELVQQAADVFEARQNGLEEPEGAWTDRVWLPSDRERRPCCEGLEPDRLKDPQKLRNHCRTLLHVASLFDLDSRVLRAEVRRRREEAKDGPTAIAPVTPLRQRRARPARAAQSEEAGSAEAVALYERLDRLIAGKEENLLAALRRATELLLQLLQQIERDRTAVEVAITETGAGEVVADLHDLLDDITHLAITRDTIRRVL